MLSKEIGGVLVLSFIRLLLATPQLKLRLYQCFWVFHPMSWKFWNVLVLERCLNFILKRSTVGISNLFTQVKELLEKVGPTSLIEMKELLTATRDVASILVRKPSELEQQLLKALNEIPKTMKVTNNPVDCFCTKTD